MLPIISTTTKTLPTSTPVAVLPPRPETLPLPKCELQAVGETYLRNRIAWQEYNTAVAAAPTPAPPTPPPPTPAPVPPVYDLPDLPPRPETLPLLKCELPWQGYNTAVAAASDLARRRSLQNCSLELNYDAYGSVQIPNEIGVLLDADDTDYYVRHNTLYYKTRNDSQYRTYEWEPEAISTTIEFKRPTDVTIDWQAKTS
jgi:hypothetical protein